MNADDYIIIAFAVASIVWVNWYFLMGDRRTVAAGVGGGGTQEVDIRVEGGYDPSRIVVKRGRPVRLIFDRQETSSCSEEIVLPDFGIRRFLPAHQRTAVEFTPDKEGVFEFTCGMSMLRGKLVVENGAG